VGCFGCKNTKIIQSIYGLGPSLSGEPGISNIYCLYEKRFGLRILHYLVYTVRPHFYRGAAASSPFETYLSYTPSPVITAVTSHSRAELNQLVKKG
jgi:hypothetical protein